MLFSSLPLPPCYHLTLPCCAHLCSAQRAHMLFYLLRRAFQLLFNIIFSSHFNLEKITSFLARNKYQLGTRSETTDYENTGRKYMCPQNWTNLGAQRSSFSLAQLPQHSLEQRSSAQEDKGWQPLVSFLLQPSPHPAQGTTVTNECLFFM